MSALYGEHNQLRWRPRPKTSGRSRAARQQPHITLSLGLSSSLGSVAALTRLAGPDSAGGGRPRRPPRELDAVHVRGGGGGGDERIITVIPGAGLVRKQHCIRTSK